MRYGIAGAAMSRFYETNDGEEQIVTRQAMAERVLALIGGLWYDDEILAFGDEDAVGLPGVGRTRFPGSVWQCLRTSWR